MSRKCKQLFPLSLTWYPHNLKQKRKDDLHLFGIEAYDKYNYHHNVYKPNIDREKKF